MSGWRHPIRVNDLAGGPVSVTLEPDHQVRAELARELGLESLPAFAGKIVTRQWLDWVELAGRFSATVEQVCGVSLDPFESELQGLIEVRLAPRGSPNAQPDSEGEVSFDLESPDPPDVLEGEEVDLAHYLVEALALEIDPFPRKPGVEFDYEPEGREESPFAVLKALKDDKA